MGVHRLVFVGASLLIGGCAAAPTRTPAPPPAPEAATAPETAATEPPPVEITEPPKLLAAKPEQATNSGGGSEYGTSAGEKIVMGAMQMSSANTDVTGPTFGPIPARAPSVQTASTSSPCIPP